MGLTEDLNNRLKEKQDEYPEYHIVLWFHDGGTPKFLNGSRWLRRKWEEIPCHDLIPQSWHYEIYVILEGTFEYSHPDMTIFNRHKYVVATVPVDSDGKYRFSLKTDKFNLTNWMQRFEDGVKLDELTLPASHCSIALDSLLATAELGLSPGRDEGLKKKLIELHTCHQRSIKDQLEKGVRLLDLRVGSFFRMSKGPFLLYTHIAHILHGVCEDFVKANPSETVLVLISWSQEFATVDPNQKWPNCYSSTPIKQPDSFGEGIKDLLVNREKWYTKKDWPKLCDVRGKCVLLRGFSYADNSFGLDSEFAIPFLDYAKKDLDGVSQLIDARWRTFNQRFHSSNTTTQVISLSATLERDPNVSTCWVDPHDASISMIGKLRERELELNLNGPRLWVFCDYISEESATLIVKINMKRESIT